MTRFEDTIEVAVPVRTAYDQWTQFEEFPRFMGGVQQVVQNGPALTHWVAEVGGVKREWDAAILEQVPDTRVAWAATSGATNAGAVHFIPVDAGRTIVRLVLEYEPEGLVEKAGDALNLVERRVKGDLEKFKEFIEARGSATGGWRESVDPGVDLGDAPGVEAAALSRGDSGSAGLTTGAAVAGAAVLAAAGVAVAKAVRHHGEEEEQAPVTPSSAIPGETGSASTPAQSIETTITQPAPGTAERTAASTAATSEAAAPVVADEPSAVAGDVPEIPVLGTIDPDAASTPDVGTGPTYETSTGGGTDTLADDALLDGVRKSDDADGGR